MNVTLNRVLNPLTLTLFFAGLVLSTADAYAEVAVLQQIQGEVLIHASSAPADEWKAVTADTPLNDGDSVKTGSGTAVLTYTDQATIEVASNSTLTVKDSPQTQDISLTLGRLHAKVNHDKVTKPFQIVTPVGVAAVRGTDVDFGFDENGQLTVDLHNGNIQVLNEGAELTIDLDGGKKITLKYANDVLVVGNDCASGGPVTLNAAGQSYSVAACDSQNITFETAAGGQTPPDTKTDGNPNETTPNEGGGDDGGDEEIPPSVSGGGDTGGDFGGDFGGETGTQS